MGIPTKALYLIHWKDICSPGQYWGDDLEWGTMDCFTVGYVARRSKDEIAIAQTVCTDGTFGGVMSIPNGCVVSMKRVRSVRG